MFNIKLSKTQEDKNAEAKRELELQMQTTELKINMLNTRASDYRARANEEYEYGSMALAVSLLKRARIMEKGCELLANINVNSDMIITAMDTMTTLNNHMGCSETLLGSDLHEDSHKIDKAHEIHDKINDTYNRISDLFRLFTDTTTSTISTTSAVGENAESLEDEWKKLAIPQRNPTQRHQAKPSRVSKPVNSPIQEISNLYIKSKLAHLQDVPRHDLPLVKNAPKRVSRGRVLRDAIQH